MIVNNILLSIIAGLGGMFGWGISDFFAAISSKKTGNFKTFFWSQLAGLIFSLLLMAVFAVKLSIPREIALLLPFAALIYTAGYLLFYKGFEVGNISVVSAAQNLWVVFTIVIAYIFLGQRLSQSQFIGILMILFGILLVVVRWDEIRSKNIKFFSGVFESVFAAFLFGIFWNLIDIISKSIGWLPTTVFIKSGVIVYLLLFSVFIKREKLSIKSSFRIKIYIALAGLLEAIAVLSVNWGLTIGKVILVSPVSSALSVVTIIMAFLFLKEKMTKIQVLGIVSATAGIILTSF